MAQRCGKRITAFEEWFENRTRLLFELKVSEICPLETVCAKSGTAFKARKTVAEVCNEKDCKLFYTHPESTPPEFLEFFAAAMEMREARICELRASFERLETESPFWAVMAYKAAERAFRVVEAEQGEKDVKGGKNPLDIEKTGGSGAFDLIVAAKREQKKEMDQSGEIAAQKELESNPELEPLIETFFWKNL